MSASLFAPELNTETSGPSWLHARRAAAVSMLSTMTMPLAEEEVWRYSRVDAVVPAEFSAPSSTVSKLSPSIVDTIESLCMSLGDIGGRIVVVDGQISDEHGITFEEAGKNGASIEAITKSSTEIPSVGERDDVFVVANDAYFTEGVAITIPERVQLDRPLVVVHVVTQDATVTFPRTIISVGSQSQVKVVELLISADVHALVIPNSEFTLADGSQLHHVVVQNFGEQVTSIARQSSNVNRDATLSSSNIVFGGEFARLRTDTFLNGDGADSRLAAVYFGVHNQMHDFRTLQEHVAPHTKSDLYFRGAVADTAHAVYSGLIRIRKGANGSDSVQSNRTLKLSPDAVADSVPNLEIDENDVKCAHASAVGPIGDDERYYLESRGVPTPDAERLIVLGFLAEVFERVSITGVANFARELLEQKWEARS